MQGQGAISGEAVPAEVRKRYHDVARNPADQYCHTGRPLAALLGYDETFADTLPDRAIESFSGVANPFSLRHLQSGERVVNVGSGGGFDSFVAADQVGPDGYVIGVEMTDAMLEKSRATAEQLGLAGRVEFREGFTEQLPVDDGWADVVISNGVFNLGPDKQAELSEAWRVLRPRGVLQFAEIANGRTVPVDAFGRVDSSTGWVCVAAGLPSAGWGELLTQVGFVDVTVGPAVDTFAGAAGEPNARIFDVFDYAFLASEPTATALTR